MKIGTVRIETIDETGAGPEIATVKVYRGFILLATVTAHIEPMQGADGGYYRRITFETERAK